METKDIAIIAALFAVAGFNLYRKYIKKNKENAASATNYKSTLSGKDDYEPYSGK